MDTNPSRSCRGCSLEGGESKMYSLSVTETRNLFFFCTSIWVPAGLDEDTAHICFHCYKECEKWQSFKRMCEETEDRLQKPQPLLHIEDPDPADNDIELELHSSLPSIKIEKIEEEVLDEEMDTKIGILNPEREFIWNPFSTEPDDDDSKELNPLYDDIAETLYPNPLAEVPWDINDEPEIELTSTIKVEEEMWAEEINSEPEEAEEEDHVHPSNEIETDLELIESTAVEWLPHLDPPEDIESVPLSLRKKEVNGVKVKKRKWKEAKDRLTNGDVGEKKKRRRKKRKRLEPDPLEVQSIPTVDSIIPSATPAEPVNGKRRRGRRKKGEEYGPPTEVAKKVKKIRISKTPCKDPTWRNYSDPNNWDCPNCTLRFRDEKSLRIHFRTELTDHCMICMIPFKIRGSIIPHVLRYHMKKWDCQHCSKTLDSSAGFTRHMNLYHRKHNGLPSKKDC